MNDHYVIGIDYGTDSVRSVLVSTADGAELASSVFLYPRWMDGQFCDPTRNQFRQHPQDYLLGLEATVRDCLRKAGLGAAAKVKAISVDTTGSSPVAVDRTGTPLALRPEFHENPNAMFVLWKDHTAVAEAAEINAHVTRYKPNYLTYVGGTYSAEWYWAKLLHVLRIDQAVRKSCYTWVEHCDWIPFLLTGGTQADEIKRSRCAAGHKALWSEQFGGYPPDEFFYELDPLLSGYAAWLPKATYTADEPAGTLCSAWAEKLGLPEGIVIGIGAFDAHMGAAGGQIEPYYLSKVMGTSTCDMLVAPERELQGRVISGICGQVNGSILPAMIGFEAGQSAFGDLFAWFAGLLNWPMDKILSKTKLLEPGLATLIIAETKEQLLAELSKAAAQLPPDADGPLATDWINGRRTPDANQEIKAAISGLSLGSNPPVLFKALAEAACFGARAIIERFESEGIPIKGLIGIGGVARKSPYVMQLMADTTGRTLRINAAEQTCALGAAMFAAVAAGIYPNIDEAMRSMGHGFDREYHPDPSKEVYYNQRYAAYQRLGYFTEEEVHERI